MVEILLFPLHKGIKMQKKKKTAEAFLHRKRQDKGTFLIVVIDHIPINIGHTLCAMPFPEIICVNSCLLPSQFLFLTCELKWCINRL